jgi:hypothetical protein
MAQVVNFHADDNNQLSFPGVGYDELFAGQGAYSDPGNDIWNGFGFTAGYGSTYFYSGGPGGSPPWPQQFGNPGNPYAAYDAGSGWISSTGTNLFVMAPGSGSPTNSGNATSAGLWTPVTLSVAVYSADNGIASFGAFYVPNGTPSFLLGEAAINNGTSPDIVFTLHNVPAGTYGLFLYGANEDNNRGTAFAVSSGTPHNGISATLNGQNGSPAPAFVEGQNFVVFQNVTPNASGNIIITASPNPQDGVGNSNDSGETDVNGFQLIFNPPPTALASTPAQNVLSGGTASFSFTPAFATSPSFRWQFVTGTATNNLSDGPYNGATISGSLTTNLTVSGVTAANVGLYQCVITAGASTGTSPAAPLAIVSSTNNASLQSGDPGTLISDILQAGDTLSDFNNTNDFPYDSIPPAFDMGVGNVEDGTLNQYVNFGTNGSVPPFGGPVGFVVTPQVGTTVAKGVRFFTSSSHPEDDPANYFLEGSTNGGTTFAPISGGPLALPPQRNAAGGPINVASQVFQEVDFANTTAYTTYRLTVTNVNNGNIASNGMQVAEVQIIGSLPPVPPNILQQPESAQILLAGETLNASVVAGGTGPISYQWYYNTTHLIANATNAALTVPTVQSTNAGTYTCVVSNNYGPATSTPMTLTVVTPNTYESAIVADHALAFFPLFETNGTTAYDYAGGHNGTYLNGPTLGVEGPTPELPVAASFDGTTNYVLIPSTPALNFAGQITLEAWVLVNTVPSLGDILAKGYDGNQDSAEIEMRVQSSSDSYYGGYYDGTVGGYGPTGGTISGNWAYIVLAFDGSNWNLYENSLLVGQASDSGDNDQGVHYFADPWAIANGTTGGNGRLFSGRICAAAIYNYGLSPAQVASHYFAGGAPPVITVPPLDSVVILNSNVTMGVTAVGAQPLSYQWYNGAPSSTYAIANATNSTLTFANAQPSSDGSYYVVVTDAYGYSATNTTAATLTVLTTAPLPGKYATSVLNLNPLAYWPLNETNQPPPVQGALNIGTLGAAGNGNFSFNNDNIEFQQTGALLDTRPGDTNYSIHTDGASGSVIVPFGPALSNSPPFTVEAWLSADSIDTPACALSCVTASSPRSGWLIYMDEFAGPGYWDFRAYDENGTSATINLVTTNIVANSTWHHLVVVVNTNGNPTPVNGVYPAGSVFASIYLDGQFNANSSAVAYAMNNYGPFTIGCRADNAFFFPGSFAQVAYYTNALSSNTIFAHYAAGTNTAPTPPYYQLVQQSNPLLYLQLADPQPSYPDESSDPVANNYGGTGANDNGYYLPGTVPGAVPGPYVVGFPATGTNNVAAAFNHFTWMQDNNGNTGVSGFVDVPYNTGDLNILGPVTMTAWIKANPSIILNAGRFQTFAGRGDNSYRMDVDGANTNALHFAYGGAGDLVGNSPAGYLNDGRWHFVVGEWDGLTQWLYVDGFFNASNAAPVAPAGTTVLDFTIGEAPDDTGRVFDGAIAQVAIFGYALSPSQVQSLYYSAELPPSFTQQPPASIAEPEGVNVTLAATAIGNPTLVYQWFNGTNKVVNGGEFSGATSNTLTITAATPVADGTYTLVVTNSYGAITSSPVALTIIAGKPVVETDISPLLQTATYDEPITFSVGVAGTPPFFYQWIQDGVAVPGATNSSFSFDALVGSNTYSVTITNTIGSASSSTAVVLGPLAPPPIVGFNGNGNNWDIAKLSTWPGSPTTPSIINNLLTLTDGTNDETCTVFYETPQYIGGFFASFIYQEAPGTSPVADGITFCIQNSGPGATGGEGNELGYTGITPSAALEINIYTGDRGGVGIQFGTDGATPASSYGTPQYIGDFLGTAPVNLISGDPIYVQLYYGQNVATVTLVDSVAATSFTTSFNVTNLPVIVGAPAAGTAYVGFTAGTGALNAIQTVSNFVFSSTSPPVLSVTRGAGESVTVSWLVSVSSLFTLQQSTSPSGPWSTVTKNIQLVNGVNEFTPTPGNNVMFYRLNLP